MIYSFSVCPLIALGILFLIPSCNFSHLDFGYEREKFHVWKDRESRCYGHKWRSVKGRDHAVLKSGGMRFIVKWWSDWPLSQLNKGPTVERSKIVVKIPNYYTRYSGDNSVAYGNLFGPSPQKRQNYSVGIRGGQILKRLASRPPKRRF